MSKEVINISSGRKLPFSSAVRAGDFIFLSGHAGMRDDDGNPLETVEDQTRKTLENISKTLKAAGASLDDVVKVTVYLGDQGHFSRMNEVYGTFFKEDLPARSTCITGLAVPNMLLEMECVAYSPRR
ncbi:MAG TPA: RidA family protein [Patescibacteria group bacterium]|nr:RidA family protein [Patescibacteria group bacterium]